MESQLDKLLENEEKITKYKSKHLDSLFRISLFLSFILYQLIEEIELLKAVNIKVIFLIPFLFFYMFIHLKDSKLHLEIAKRIKNLESK